MAFPGGDENDQKSPAVGVVNAGMFADENTTLTPAAKQAHLKDHEILIPESETVSAQLYISL